MAYQAGAFPGFCSMKHLGVFLLAPGWDASLIPPGWDTSPSQGYPPPPTLNSLAPIYTPGWMYLARARIRTVRSEDERTNHESTVPLTN